MFLVMDSVVLPEHIKHTFKLSETEKGWWSGLGGLDVAVEGDEINLKAAGYVIVYASNIWHINKATEMYDQIRGLRYDALLMGIPVEVDLKQSAPTPVPDPDVWFANWGKP